MNRIESLFTKLSAANKKAFVAYIVAGDPSLEKTVDIVLDLEKAGADIIELGIPFSDPLADGVVNQLGAQRALTAGATLKGIFKTVEKIRQHSQIPIVLFTYYNPVFHLGLQEFSKQALAAGVDGALILDLPPEEAEKEWPENELKRITLIAPTTLPDRIEKITASASGFIYYVSRAGVTGMQNQIAGGIEEQIAKIRTHTRLPICVGFGISKPEQVKQIAHLADGVVVGSAIVNHIANLQQDAAIGAKVAAFAQPLIQAAHGK